MLSEYVVICLTLFFEVGICPKQDVRAVARVIQIRAQERGVSFRDVCLERKQFSCWNGKANKRKMLSAYKLGVMQLSANWRVCEDVANEMINGRLDAMPKWNHYYAHKICTPGWSSRMKDTLQTKYHVYGRIES